MNIKNVIGLSILIAFYGSYLVKAVMQSRKGIKTDRMGKGDKPERTFVIEVILKITTFSTAAVQFISVVFSEKFTALINSNYIIYAGFAISVLGIIVFVSAMATMHDSWRAGIDNTQKTKMVTRGIYRYSRNPAFVGFDLLYAGTALSFSNVINIIFACAAVIMLHLQILEEEKFLPSVFGKEYMDYKKSTRRYIGRK